MVDTLKIVARISAVALGLLPSLAAAQNACSTAELPPTLDGPRLLTSSSSGPGLRLASELPLRTCADTSVIPSAGIQWTPVSLRGSYRSAYPVDRNNGAVWDGKGATLSLHGGVRYVGPNVRVSVMPRVAFQQNARFVTAAVRHANHPLGNLYEGLDWPQRFGEAAFWTLDAGETAVALSGGPAELMVGTDNIWWGPARRYPLLFGSSAPGFPHIAIGLVRPVSVGVGDLRARILWGRLDESDYFDTDASDDLRLITGVFLEFAPEFLPGFTLGVSGVQHNYWRDASRLFLDVFTFMFTKEESSEGNGLLSLTAEWSDPASGFAVYTEWARDDYWLDVEDLLTEPDHSQAYTIGFEKLYKRPGTSLRLAYELTHLGMAAPEQTGRSFGGVRFYTHWRQIQGHTNRGQLLGSWIGPGADAQYLGLSLESASRVMGAYLERVRRNEDEYYARFAGAYGFRGHDLEWTLGFQGLEPIGPLQLQWQGGIARRKNRDFIGLDGINWDFRRETNVELTATLWWLPGR